jgi:hypothetical protein
VSVFQRLTVDTKFNLITNQRVMVSWVFTRDFTAPGPYTFTLQRATGVTTNESDWQDIAQCVDQPWIYDNSPLSSTLQIPVYYRVILVDGDGVRYVSQAVTEEAYWDRYDWQIAKEIVRKESMLLRKRSGVRGWLLKRRTFGDACTQCTDPVTGQILNSQCTACYGTGVEGGYFEPFEYWIALDPAERKTRLDPEAGYMTVVVETARALAYPIPQPNDLWVNSHTNNRYVIQGDIVAVARHRGIDLVLNLRLKLLETAHVAYQFPTPCS